MDSWYVAVRGVDAPCCERVAHRGASVSASESGACVPTSAAQPRLGFDRARRITRRVDFERLLREGTRRSADGYLFYTTRRVCGSARLGIVISRRHARLAATRNAVKRIIREAFRLEQSRLGPIDVLVRPPLGVRPSREMLIRMRILLGRLEEK